MQAYLLGYGYLGGFVVPAAINNWVAPYRTSDDPNLVLIYDLNDWTYPSANNWAVSSATLRSQASAITTRATTKGP